VGDDVSASTRGKWERAGTIGVDAGLVWIGDPCYLFNDENEPPTLGATYEDFIDTLRDREVDNVARFPHANGKVGLGVALYTANGDGTYPVDVLRDVAGRVLEVRIRFGGR
jgi:hypothetical protein